MPATPADHRLAGCPRSLAFGDRGEVLHLLRPSALHWSYLAARPSSSSCPILIQCPKFAHSGCLPLRHNRSSRECSPTLQASDTDVNVRDHALLEVTLLEQFGFVLNGLRFRRAATVSSPARTSASGRLPLSCWPTPDHAQAGCALLLIPRSLFPIAYSLLPSFSRTQSTITGDTRSMAASRNVILSASIM